MIAWFRAKAVEFNRIATVLETTFSQSGQPLVQPLQATPAEVDIDAVKNAISELGKPSRYSKIAKYLNADSGQVWNVLKNSPTVFDQAGRGWWKLK